MKQRLAGWVPALAALFVIQFGTWSDTCAAEDLQSFSGSSQTTSTVPSLCIINEVPFHYEVFSGFISALHDHFPDIRTYPNVKHKRHWELPAALVETWRDMPPVLLPHNHNRRSSDDIPDPPDQPLHPCDLGIFISPQYALWKTRQFIKTYDFKAVVLVVHRDNASEVNSLMKLHHNTHWVTLAPHVQRHLANITKKHVEWMLPTANLPPLPGDCAPEQYETCLSGFTIQGAVSNRRRNYTHAFQELGKIVNASQEGGTTLDSRMRLDLVGVVLHPEEVQNVLHPPEYIRDRIKLHRDENATEFYSLLRRSFAMMPAFVNSDYYFKAKITSAIISSLATKVPIIVRKHFLETYTMYDERTVAYVADDESEADVMMRLVRSTGDELRAMRNALAQLQRDLNDEAVMKIKAMLEPFFADMHVTFRHTDTAIKRRALRQGILGRKAKHRTEQEDDTASYLPLPLVLPNVVSPED